jgi:hypothetical protein
MRWSFNNSISVIPGALLLVTVNVTGPAGTLVVSSEQASFPASLAKVTFTALTPLAELLLALLGVLLAASVLEPHAVTARATAEVTAGAASQKLRDNDLASPGCFTMMLLFPFRFRIAFRDSAADARRGERQDEGSRS